MILNLPILLLTPYNLVVPFWGKYPSAARTKWTHFILKHKGRQRENRNRPTANIHFRRKKPNRHRVLFHAFAILPFEHDIV